MEKISTARLLGIGIVFVSSVSAVPLNSNLHGYDIIPHEKDLDPVWVKSLTVRGAELDGPVRGSKKDDTLKYIGMPVSGIGCGTVYLNGDGRLFVWDIFNQHHEGVVPQRCKVPEWINGKYTIEKGKHTDVRERNGTSLLNPPTPDKFPNFFKQGFSLHDGTRERSMDVHGWDDVSFLGKWPVGEVTYAAADSPVTVQLKAFSPFIPLNAEDSSLPVTIMEYTVTNTSDTPQKVTLTGVLENPLGHYSKQGALRRTESLNGRGLVHRMELDDPAKATWEDFGSMAMIVLGDAEPALSLEDGRLSASRQLAAGGSHSFRFVIGWHLPNVNKRVVKSAGDGVKRYYAKTFSDAAAVVEHVSRHYDRLAGQTDLWVKTWYDSSLPHWLMDRAIIPLDTLQTANCYILLNAKGQKQFWAWEGIGACAGTCTHVWHYAQAMARLFPSLERNLREVTDFGIAIREDGSVPYRIRGGTAWDGQCGTVLRSYREHLMSSDDRFLKENWEKIKLATSFLINFDRNDNDGHNGIPNGKLHMTLDANWYGKVHELCSLYLAALRAGEEMARETGDAEFEKLCRETYEMGRKNIEELFVDEYYIHEEDPNHPDAIGPGKGCYIDQVMGQFWAFQLGLGRLHDEDHIRASLNSLWKYNFLTDVGPFRARFPMGRFYSAPGDGGLLICTWPKGGLKEAYRKQWQFMYFNETMSGYEHQVAAHMVAEGTPDLIEKGLAVMRVIHDRYASEKRNPYNELECSDHYARAMASYGTFISACGFDYHGPKGRIGFNPRIGADDFKVPFTSADGWGTYSQQTTDKGIEATLLIRYGALELEEWAVTLPEGRSPQSLKIVQKGKAVHGRFETENEKVRILFPERLRIEQEESLQVRIKYK